MNLTKQEKTAILQAKLQQWKQRHFSLDLDVKVAKAVEDQAMLEGLKPELKKCIAALELLQKELDELDK